MQTGLADLVETAWVMCYYTKGAFNGLDDLLWSSDLDQWFYW